jgi:hypothetical protein
MSLTGQAMAQTRIERLLDRYAVGPGPGLLVLGLAYLVFWLMPFTIDVYIKENRWAHNWAFSIIIFTVGAAWYQKTALSRTIAVIQASMLPITASGSFNTLYCSFVTVGIALIWGVVVAAERMRKEPFLQAWMEKRSWSWTNMHTMILCWLLIAHMAFVFFATRVPQEAGLLTATARVGFLTNLPPESHDFATWFFNISILVWAILAIYEQFKMGYNPQNKPWPRLSFWWVFVSIVAGFVGMGLNQMLH